jgi:hypothetical protein
MTIQMTKHTPRTGQTMKFKYKKYCNHCKKRFCTYKSSVVYCDECSELYFSKPRSETNEIQREQK